MMSKYFLIVLVALIILPSVFVFLGSHDNCPNQICHKIMTLVYGLPTLIAYQVIFLSFGLLLFKFSYKYIYLIEIFSPPRA